MQEPSPQPVLSVIIPCYNEEATIAECIRRVKQLEGNGRSLEIIVIDDCSLDSSYRIVERISESSSNVKLYRQDVNMGKGAALRMGFEKATGDFIVVQDADLEYNPMDILKLLKPLEENKADVVYGSRFLTGESHRVLYFYHSLGNKFLTLMSNIFTDINLTDMETCYKVFRKEIIKDIEIEENRFGFEPEITAKVAQKRCRIYEIGISYEGRTYAEGKKIGWKDGVRALYCIFKYNAHLAPVPIQLAIYFFIGFVAALANLVLFLAFMRAGYAIEISTLLAFVLAAVVNYFLSIAILFKRNVKWAPFSEIVVYTLVVFAIGAFDMYATKFLFMTGFTAAGAKIISTILAFVLNFAGRKYIVFPEKGIPGY